LARRAEAAPYAPIYDKEVIKYGLNPLREIPGVEVSPIDDLYHEITISPEAKAAILGGRGQKTPGYAEGGVVDYDPEHVENLAAQVRENRYAQGGLVSSYDDAMIDDLANQIREGIYG
jgi:hypothetical protein